MVRIYTRGGDDGQTSLGDGSRTGKASPRVTAYGELDELISWLGLCGVALRDAAPDLQQVPAVAGLNQVVTGIQNRLFDIGAVLADPVRSAELARLPETDQPFVADALERSIDDLDAGLAPLRAFILPGGHTGAAQLHLARAVCRRVERTVVDLAAAEPLPASIVIYLNRLSDFLFTAARAVNAATGVPDILWQKGD